MPVPPLPFSGTFPSDAAASSGNANDTISYTSVTNGANAHPHVLLPYANVESVVWELQGQPVATPHLDALLTLLRSEATLSVDAHDFCPSHERMAARWLGWDGADSAVTLPWAALTAQTLGHSDDLGGTWAFMTPCHWTVGADQIRLDNPADLALNATESQALLEILKPWFAEDGLHLHPWRPDCWLVQGDVLAGLTSAALDRALLRDVRHWSPEAGQNRTLQRLHSEVQMLLYTHPFNVQREAAGQSPVNAFWLHAIGPLPCSAATTPALQVWEQLREPALIGGSTAWLQAWQQLDAGPIADLLRHVQSGGQATLALCGERSARSFTTSQPSWSQRIQRIFRPQRFSSIREAL